MIYITVSSEFLVGNKCSMDHCSVIECKYWIVFISSICYYIIQIVCGRGLYMMIEYILFKYDICSQIIKTKQEVHNCANCIFL